MRGNNYSAYTFPDIELYAGDTTEWVVPVYIDYTGNPFDVDMSLLSAELTILPHNMSVNMGSDQLADLAPSLSIEGTLDSGGAFHFVFTEQDTKDFKGKYKYQIDVRYENELRICQGNVYFRRNINR